MADWKKNVRKVPDSVRRKLDRMEDDQIVVAVVKKIALDTVRAGTYKHVGVAVEEGALVVPEAVVPPAGQGRYSGENAQGREVKRTDLPKVPKVFTFEVPDWGDWSIGSHTVEQERLVYRVDFRPPRELAVQIRVLAKEEGDNPSFVFKFQIAEVLSRSHPDFEDRLFFNLNLLQENVGHCDVYPADADLPEFLQTVYVAWEILPPGHRDENIARIVAGTGRKSAQIQRVVAERYDLLDRLRPECFVHGRSGFRRYFGAKFADDLVVFENIEHGNAAYVMFERWETLSQKTRLELLAGPAEGFVRVVHRPGWQSVLAHIVTECRQQKVAG